MRGTAGWSGHTVAAAAVDECAALDEDGEDLDEDGEGVEIDSNEAVAAAAVAGAQRGLGIGFPPRAAGVGGPGRREAGGAEGGAARSRSARATHPPHGALPREDTARPHRPPSRCSLSAQCPPAGRRGEGCPSGPNRRRARAVGRTRRRLAHRMDPPAAGPAADGPNARPAPPCGPRRRCRATPARPARRGVDRHDRPILAGPPTRRRAACPPAPDPAHAAGAALPRPAGRSGRPSPSRRGRRDRRTSATARHAASRATCAACGGRVSGCDG
eukprot:scaffold21919_cov112-Isochrysis_galbana.AAC.1